jgi:DNA-binding FadR family transcriptional regulator
MINNSINLTEKQKTFLDYLIEFNKDKNREIPSIQEISEDLGISTATLREQMELAKNLGFITAQPRKGVELLPYKFTPAASKSLYYAVNLDYAYFFQYSEVRSHLEKAYFLESVEKLSKEDLKKIQKFVYSAFDKLNGDPVRIPHEEHRSYHLAFYSRQQNIFLTGILEAYWDVYEYMGLNLYTDLEYLKNVWAYHEKIIDLCIEEKIKEAYELLGKHMEFIYERKNKQEE